MAIHQGCTAAKEKGRLTYLTAPSEQPVTGEEGAHPDELHRYIGHLHGTRMLTSKAPAQRHYHSRPLGYPQKADADIANVLTIDEARCIASKMCLTEHRPEPYSSDAAPSDVFIGRGEVVRTTF